MFPFPFPLPFVFVFFLLRSFLCLFLVFCLRLGLCFGLGCSVGCDGRAEAGQDGEPGRADVFGDGWGGEDGDNFFLYGGEAAHFFLDGVDGVREECCGYSRLYCRGMKRNEG